MARSAKQVAAQRKATAVSAARRKNANAYKAAAPKVLKPHPNESAAGTKLYGIRRQFEKAKPGSVRNQLHAQLKSARRAYHG